MPVVTTFFGIVIRMFYQEHGCPAFTPNTRVSKRLFGSMGKYWPVVFNLAPRCD